MKVFHATVYDGLGWMLLSFGGFRDVEDKTIVKGIWYQHELCDIEGRKL